VGLCRGLLLHRPGAFGAGEQRRADLAGEIATARQAYRQGQVRRGTVDDLMAEIGE